MPWLDIAAIGFGGFMLGVLVTLATLGLIAKIVMSRNPMLGSFFRKPPPTPPTSQVSGWR